MYAQKCLAPDRQYVIGADAVAVGVNTNRLAHRLDVTRMDGAVSMVDREVEAAIAEGISGRNQCQRAVRADRGFHQDNRITIGQGEDDLGAHTVESGYPCGRVGAGVEHTVA